MRHTSVTFQLTVFFICMILFGYGFAALTCHAAANWGLQIDRKGAAMCAYSPLTFIVKFPMAIVPYALSFPFKIIGEITDLWSHPMWKVPLAFFGLLAVGGLIGLIALLCGNGSGQYHESGYSVTKDSQSGKEYTTTHYRKKQ